MHAHAGSVDHPHIAAVSICHRIHDPIPDTGLRPEPEPVVAGGRRAIALRQVPPGRPRPQHPEMPFSTRRSSTRGTPRGLCGSSSITRHSNSVRSYRLIQGSHLGALNQTQADLGIPLMSSRPSFHIRFRAPAGSRWVAGMAAQSRNLGLLALSCSWIRDPDGVLHDRARMAPLGVFSRVRSKQLLE
jgi:hypothetical protein